MEESQQQQEAPAEVQIQKIMENIVALNGKIDDSKIILKGYKIKSERLTQLKRARKEMTEQINDEKKNIEDGFLEDKDYEEASNDLLNNKNKLKEATAMLRVAVGKKYNAPGLQTEDHLVSGDQYKLQLQFSPQIYINGKEFK
jgi:predicted Zn-dependent protease